MSTGPQSLYRIGRQEGEHPTPPPAPSPVPRPREPKLIPPQNEWGSQ